MVKMECETSDKTVKLLPCLMLDVGERMLVAGAEVSRPACKAGALAN